MHYKEIKLKYLLSPNFYGLCEEDIKNLHLSISIQMSIFTLKDQPFPIFVALIHSYSTSS